MKIILGSASKQRKKILKKMGYDFEVMAADIDEKAIRFDDPVKLTLALAHAKADALMKRINEPVILITADQVVFCDGKIIEKPESEAEAINFLKIYEKFPPQVVSSVVVTNTEKNKRFKGSDIPIVFFKPEPIPENVVQKLIKQKNIFSQCGAFSVEDPLIAPYIDRIEGSVDSVEGLPVKLTEKLIRKALNY